MRKQILFIHGGGDDGYHADLRIRDDLAKQLEEQFVMRYPQMPSNEDLPDFGWLTKIESEIKELGDGLILIGHSLGASMLLRYLSENDVPIEVRGIFLLGTPFWTGKEGWKQGLKLKEGFARRLPPDIPMYFYHCKDDEIVDFSNLQKYRQQLPMATFLELDQGGHQFDGSVSRVAHDVAILFK